MHEQFSLFDEPRKCTGCSAIKSSSEFWRRKGKVRPRCKDCERAKTSKYRAENKPYIKAIGKAYREKNKEALSAYSRAYHQANADRIRRVKAQWRRTNSDRIRETNRAWIQANYERHATNLRNYKARKRQAEGTIEPGTVAQMIEDQGGLCAYCETPLVEGGVHADHMEPIVRGGLNDWSNLAIACAHCNSSKRHRTAVEFVEYLRIVGNATIPETGFIC